MAGEITTTYGMGNMLPPSYYQQQDPSAGWSPYPGMPGRPGYTPSYDPWSMSMVGRMQDKINAINPNTQGIDAYRQEALRTGPSAWAGMAGKQQDMEASRGIDKARAQTAGKQADAESAMAMRGGVDSGARERIARQGNQDFMSAAQGIEGQKMTNKMQIGLNDEQNRISQMGALPGMENQALQPQFDKLKLSGQANESDINNMKSDLTNRNLYNMQGYHEQMSAIGANNQANATANSGKK